MESNKIFYGLVRWLEGNDPRLVDPPPSSTKKKKDDWDTKWPKVDVLFTLPREWLLYAVELMMKPLMIRAVSSLSPLAWFLNRSYLRFRGVQRMNACSVIRQYVERRLVLGFFFFCIGHDTKMVQIYSIANGNWVERDTCLRNRMVASNLSWSFLCRSDDLVYKVD